MISDIALLKDLPEEIRHSVTAYVACIARATTKNDYLEAIRTAGFEDTKVLGEAAYSAEFLANDPIAVEVAKNLKLSRKSAEDLASSVIGIKVSAIKSAAR